MLIDRGTPEGFRLISEAREWLLRPQETETPCHVVAPVSLITVYCGSFLRWPSSVLTMAPAQCKAPNPGVISLSVFNDQDLWQVVCWIGDRPTHSVIV